MEGVGARLGRSSTRYGPATVFSGPVRKWKKRWVHVNPSSNHNSFHSHHHNATTNAAAASSSAANHSSSSNGNNGSHLLLYKWTPLSQSNGSSSTTNHFNGNNINTTNENANLSNGDVTEEPPRRKFKYIPVDLLERQKKEAEEQEASEKFDDESKPSDTDPNAAEPVSKSDSADEKPDINDVPMEENQDGNQVVRQDLNESTLDLSLGLLS
ncbi:hypothetical protein D5086_007714 [Populus alba]|uniref:Uncharacterized protein n=3 Tax=Populus TaxID=3689 RepID=A0ACC4CEL2_POPAL|nr:myb-like protein I [Populus alba]KAJ6999331.1 myb-like protein I [Populus alba x Populus x berolinensis]TKS05732.1 hypothetical protein D5086_0000130370 [Populus alba]